MLYFSLLQPAAETIQEKIICKILAPDGAVFNACLCQRRIEIEQTHQSRPGAAPVGNREDWSPVCEQPGKDVMAVLPHCLGNDQRRIGGN